MGDKKLRVPCETCEGGFHEVPVEELKKFTNSIHNPSAEPLEGADPHYPSAEEIAAKIKVPTAEEIGAQVPVARIDPSEVAEILMKQEHPVQLVDYHGFKSHLNNCPACQKLVDDEQVANLPALAEAHGYTLKAETPPVETPLDAPPVETPVETPPTETPPDAPPVETPVETPPTETPVETPPTETPVEKPEEGSVEGTMQSVFKK